MDAEIKKLADSRDLKSLKYIFVDSLDVDPTFVRYEEEYNYCKSIPGLLEPHQELTPFTENKAFWNENYWTNLKRDLIKNFSDKRMTHMREVAKIFLAEKIQRILAERSVSVPERPKAEPVNAMPKPNASSMAHIPGRADTPAKPRLSKAEEQELELKKTKERLERERKAREEHIRAENARREQQRYQSQHVGNSGNGAGSKKARGIAVAVVSVIVVAAVVIAVILLQK